MRGLLALLVLALASAAQAQVGAVLDGPGETRPELPDFEPPPQERGDVLPEVRVPALPGTSGLSGGQVVALRGVRFEGVTALDPARLEELARPYLGREIGIAELEMLRDEVTLAYVERGYATSGAVIPEQEIVDGIVVLRVIEGRLERVVVETDGRFRPDYVARRLAVSDGPVNVHEMEARLRLLQQDPRIRSVRAELLPGERRGEAVLRVALTEEPAYRIGLAFDNHRSPSIGSYQGTLDLDLPNVAGFGDRFRVRYSRTLGLNRVDAVYDVPLPQLAEWGTHWDVHFRWSDADVVEGVLDELGIASTLVTIGTTLHQPLYESPHARVEAFLTGEWRRSTTYLLDERFSFSPGPERGRATLALLRGGLLATVRGQHQAFAARTQVTGGIDALGATTSPDGVPGGEFVSWLTQLQYAVRLPWLGMRLIGRGDLQLASDPLLALEQIPLGGRDTVRGYRENLIVGDNGVIGSVELRLPVIRPREGLPGFELAPFFDVGRAWSHDRDGFPTSPSTTLMSVGIGGRLWLGERWLAELTWGHELEDVPVPQPWDLQDSGISFRIQGDFP